MQGCNTKKTDSQCHTEVFLYNILVWMKIWRISKSILDLGKKWFIWRFFRQNRKVGRPADYYFFVFVWTQRLIQSAVRIGLIKRNNLKYWSRSSTHHSSSLAIAWQSFSPNLSQYHHLIWTDCCSHPSLTMICDRMDWKGKWCAPNTEYEKRGFTPSLQLRKL